MPKAKEVKGESISNFEQTDQSENVFKQSETSAADEPLYSVSFKQNRAFELFVGAERILFHGCQDNPIFPEKFKHGMPQSMIENPEFQSHINYFNVRKQEN